MKKVYVLLALFALSFISPACEHEYYSIVGISIEMVTEKKSEYDGSIYWGSAEKFNSRIAFAIDKEHEFTGKGVKAALNTSGRFRLSIGAMHLQYQKKSVTPSIPTRSSCISSPR